MYLRPSGLATARLQTNPWGYGRGCATHKMGVTQPMADASSAAGSAGPMVGGSEAGTRRSGAGGLEQFDDVAGGVLQEDLRAAGAGDDLIAEAESGVA
jgi:hypothetical protein